MSDESQWNEQKLFSIMYFSLTFQARNAQSNNDVVQWKRVLESKMSMVMGVLKLPEQKQFVEYKKKLDGLYHDYLTTHHKDSINKPAKLGKLKNKLFLVEAEVDSHINKHMPFLNKKKTIDMRGL